MGTVSADLFALLCVCCAVSCFLSVLLVMKHRWHWTQPLLQRKVVSILWMVPIYSVEALVSLQTPQQAAVVDMFRDCYEAYVLYAFFSLCIAYIGVDPWNNRQEGLDMSKVLIALQEEGRVVHPPPFNRCVSSWNLGSQAKWFLARCKLNILQFVLVKPFCALLALVLSLFGCYHDGSINFGKGYVYVAFIDNISTTLSLYYLVLFYVATRHALKPHKPLAKFLCVKCVVFFTWWQGLLLSICCWLGVLHGEPGEDFHCGDVSTRIQKVLIQFEMLFLAVVHISVFSSTPYKYSPSRLGDQQRPLAALMPIDHQSLQSDLREVAPNVRPAALGGPLPVQEQRVYVPPESDHSPLEETEAGAVGSQVEMPPNAVEPAAPAYPGGAASEARASGESPAACRSPGGPLPGPPHEALQVAH